MSNLWTSHIITVCCGAVNRATGKKWGQVTFSSTCPIGQVLLKVSVEPWYGVCGLDDVTFVGDVHGLAFLWVEVHEPV